MTITQEQADAYLLNDIATYEISVANTCRYLNLNQNQYDALVSFTYNCGSGSLLQLTKNKTRTAKEIAEHIEAYNKGAGGVVLAGLVKRRKEEKELFVMEVEPTLQEKCEKIKEYYGLDDNTCLYFQFYRYNTALIDKLYNRAKNG